MCHPSSLQSKLRSIKTRLSWSLDKMLKLHRSRLDTSLCTRRSGSSQLASDETLSRTACTGTELHCTPTRSVDQLREMCPSPTLRPQAHGPDDVRLNTVIGISAGGSEAIELREFRAQQKSCGRELFMTACDSGKKSGTSSLAVPHI